MTNTQNALNKHLSNENQRNGRMLLNCPHRKGTVRQIRIVTPRKPNSARRGVVKLYLTTTRHTVSYIQGGPHNLKRYSNVLIRAGGARDLPGIYSVCIRGVKDLKYIPYKSRRRSIYGLKKRFYIEYNHFINYYFYYYN